MDPLEQLIQLAKGGNDGALASLQSLAKSGNAGASAALTEINEALSKGQFDAESLRKSLDEMLDDADAEDLSKGGDDGGDGEDAEEPDTDEENFEFDFEFDEDDDEGVAKSLAGVESRLDRLTKGVVGSGYGVLEVHDRLSKGIETMGRVEHKLDTLLKALKRPVAPAGVVQPGQKPATKPTGDLNKGTTPKASELRKSLRAKADRAQPNTPEWQVAMDALDALSIGNKQPALDLLNT